MLENIIDLNKRVLRNAKPGNKNNADAGLFIVSTEEFSDDAPICNYLIEPEDSGAFGVVTYKSTKSPNASNEDTFVYSRETDIWKIIAAGDVLTGKATTEEGTVKEMDTQDAIITSTQSISIEGDLDMSVVGQVMKDLPATSSNSNTVTFEPVPNPSILTNPSSTANPKVSLDGSILTYGEEYLLSYSNNPIYDGYRPLPSEAITANVHLLEEVSVISEISADFDGSIMLTEEGEAVNNLFEDSVKVTTPSGLDKYRDYLVNPESGQLVTIGFKENESPVNSVFSALDVYSDGLSFKKANVSLEQAIADPSVFEDALTLTEGLDFTLNGKNGGFLMLVPLAPNTSVQIKYLVEGSTRTSDFASEAVTDLRLDYFPIMPSTEKVTLKVGNESYLLTSGSDYDLYYSNGYLALTDSIIAERNLGTKEYTLNVVYSPTTSVTCYASQIDEGTMRMYFGGVVIQALSANLIQLFTDGDNIELTSLKLWDGREVNTDLTKVTQISDNVYKLNSIDKNIATEDYLLASYYIDTSVLPYAPLVRIRATLVKGQYDLVLENTTETALGIVNEDILLISSTLDTSITEYVRVQSVTALDPSNVMVTLKNPLGDNILSPKVYKTDSPVVFEGSLFFDDFGPGATELVLKETDATVLGLGYLLNLGGQQIVSIKAFSKEGSDTRVSIKPATIVASTDITSIASTTFSVYQEGDNGLLLSNPIVSNPVPVLKIIAHELTTAAVRHSFRIIDSKIKYTRRKEDDLGNITEVTTPFPIDPLSSLKKQVDDLIAFSGGELGVEYYRDNIQYISAQSLANTTMSVNDLQTPCILSAYATVYRGDEELTIVNGDYTIEGGIIVLRDAIAKNDRFLVTYTHPDTLGLEKGDIIVTEARKFVAAAKGSVINVDMEYLANDQHMIQGMTEQEFLDSYTLPYIEEQQKSAMGNAPQGSRGIEAETLNGIAQGGVYNNFMILRDQWLSHNIIWKIKEGYESRLAQFAEEMKYSSGSKVGNNDYSSTAGLLDRTRTLSDVYSQAALGVSSYFPVGYLGLSPVADARFSDSYYAYDKVTPYNVDGGVGYLGGTDLTDHDILVSDKIRLTGYAGEYTVVTIESGKIELDKEVRGAPSTTGISLAVNYRVIRVAPRSKNFFDDRGCPGLVASSPAVGPFVVNDGINYVFEEYERGYTVNTGVVVTEGVPTVEGPTYERELATTEINWKPVYITITSGGSYSIEAMAEVLESQLGTEYYVTAESEYDAEGITDSTGNVLSITWPFAIPDTEGVSAKAIRLVIRSRDKDALIRFPDTLSEAVAPVDAPTDSSSTELMADEYALPYGFQVDLGYPTDVSYSGSHYLSSSSDLSGSELISRDEEQEALNTSANAFSKVDRSQDEELASTNTASLLASFNLLMAVVFAKSAAEEVSAGSEDGSRAKSQADLAGVVYKAQIDQTTATKAVDFAWASTYLSSSKSNFAINDTQITELSKSQVNDALYNSWATLGLAQVSLKRSGGSTGTYVLLGDGTSSPSVPFGEGNADISVFPYYENPSEGISQFPLGTWLSTTSTSVSYGGSVEIFQMSTGLTIQTSLSNVTIQGLEDKLEIIVGTISHQIDYADNATIADLISTINTISGITAGVSDIASDTKYGILLPMPNSVPLVEDTLLGIPCGSVAAINFYTISDKVLLARKNEVSTRVSVLEGYISYYEDREDELWNSLKNSVDEDGEDLPNKIQEWVIKDLHRVYGPANRIAPIKRTIEGD